MSQGRVQLYIKESKQKNWTKQIQADIHHQQWEYTHIYFLQLFYSRNKAEIQSRNSQWVLKERVCIMDTSVFSYKKSAWEFIQRLLKLLY